LAAPLLLYVGTSFPIGHGKVIVPSEADQKVEQHGVLFFHSPVDFDALELVFNDKTDKWGEHSAPIGTVGGCGMVEPLGPVAGAKPLSFTGNTAKYDFPCSHPILLGEISAY
jgi:hypothetical protein